MTIDYNPLMVMSVTLVLDASQGDGPNPAYPKINTHT